MGRSGRPGPSAKLGPMAPIRWLGLVVGAAVLAGTFGSIFSTLVLPRAYPSRLADRVLRSALRLGTAISNHRSGYLAKDRVMSFVGPAGLIGLFAVWLTVLVGAYTLILWPLEPGGLLTSARSAGSALFTLGLIGGTNEAIPPGPATAVALLAAASAPATVALAIAYLPAIYGAFSRRETLVTVLQSRAGQPAWGPEIIARHQLVGIMDQLPDLYKDWEQWAADLAETHTTYPVLALFRSPNALRSWAVGLIAVLDSAALHLALSPRSAPSQARLCLRMGFTAVREIGRLWGFNGDPDPRPDGPIELTFAEFEEGVARLREAGVELERDAEDAWPHYRGWRVNYEAGLYFLCDLFRVVPAPWSGPRRGLGEIEPRRPLDRTPEDPEANRHSGGRWLGPA